MANKKQKFYDWPATFSRLTGRQGEITFVLGAKNVGKTFGLRKFAVEQFIKNKSIFCEICRTKTEMKTVSRGYFDKLQEVGFFQDYIFKTNQDCGYIAKRPKNDKDKPKWLKICYFVALTTFQNERKRTFQRPRYFIFDEAVIDVKDKYHCYLTDEYLILANILDSISRQQPYDDYKYNVFLLGNAVDLTCPYLQYFGINKVPDFGYTFYKDKSVLLHYVEPWDAEIRMKNTLVGRMLNGFEESKIIFENKFENKFDNEIAKKTSNAQFKFAIVWGKAKLGIWADMKHGIWYINNNVPAGSNAIYAFSKSDNSLNYRMIQRGDSLTKMLKEFYLAGIVRYDSVFTREVFFEILSFVGVR